MVTNTKKSLISQFIHHVLTKTLKNTKYNLNQPLLKSQKYQLFLLKEKELKVKEKVEKMKKMNE